jgi:hypothetical protein
VNPAIRGEGDPPDEGDVVRPRVPQDALPSHRPELRECHRGVVFDSAFESNRWGSREGKDFEYLGICALNGEHTWNSAATGVGELEFRL